MPLDMTIPDLAARQLRDYLRGTPGTYFAEDHPPLRLEEAYRVQAEVAKLRSAAGESIAGYKLGCIGSKVQEAFGMSGPIRGFLFGSELHPSGAVVSVSKHSSLAIEGEMAVRIGAQDQVVQVFPVIELHNYVFRAKAKSLAELVANNGLNAGVILPRQEVITADPLDASSRTLEVKINDELVDAGPLWEHARWTGGSRCMAKKSSVESRTLAKEATSYFNWDPFGPTPCKARRSYHSVRRGIWPR